MTSDFDFYVSSMDCCNARMYFCNKCTINDDDDDDDRDNKMDHSVLNNGMACNAAFRQNSLTACYHCCCYCRHHQSSVVIKMTH